MQNIFILLKKIIKDQFAGIKRGNKELINDAKLKVFILFKITIKGPYAIIKKAGVPNCLHFFST